MENLAEFGPALLLLLALMLAPALALIRLAAANIAVTMAASTAVEKASQTYCYNQAESNAKAAFAHLIKSPVFELSGLNANDIKQVDLYVDENELATGRKESSPADEPLRKTINPHADIYEYDLQVSYVMTPFMPTATWLGNFPLVTTPARFTTRAVRPVEYPDGLSNF